MAEECEVLIRAFSGLGGLGVDEKALVSALGKWRHQPEKLERLRKSFTGFFAADSSFERCEDDYIGYLRSNSPVSRTLWCYGQCIHGKGMHGGLTVCRSRTTPLTS